MKGKYKHSIEEAVISNKWGDKRWGDFTLIGISKKWFSPTEYEWVLSFFGLDVRIFMKREFKLKNK